MSLDDGFNPQRLSLDAVLAQESVQRWPTNLQLFGYPAKISLVDGEDMGNEVCLETVPSLF